MKSCSEKKHARLKIRPKIFNFSFGFHLFSWHSNSTNAKRRKRQKLTKTMKSNFSESMLWLQSVWCHFSSKNFWCNLQHFSWQFLWHSSDSHFSVPWKHATTGSTKIMCGTVLWFGNIPTGMWDLEGTSKNTHDHLQCNSILALSISLHNSTMKVPGLGPAQCVVRALQDATQRVKPQQHTLDIKEEGRTMMFNIIFGQFLFKNLHVICSSFASSDSFFMKFWDHHSSSWDDNCHFWRDANLTHTNSVQSWSMMLTAVNMTHQRLTHWPIDTWAKPCATVTFWESQMHLVHCQWCQERTGTIAEAGIVNFSNQSCDSTEIAIAMWKSCWSLCKIEKIWRTENVTKSRMLSTQTWNLSSQSSPHCLIQWITFAWATWNLSQRICVSNQFFDSKWLLLKELFSRDDVTTLVNLWWQLTFILHKQKSDWFAIFFMKGAEFCGR